MTSQRLLMGDFFGAGRSSKKSTFRVTSGGGGVIGRVRTLIEGMYSQVCIIWDL